MNNKPYASFTPGIVLEIPGVMYIIDRIKIEILPMDKSGNRRIVPVEVHIEKADVHILENEEASREYILQAWAEIMSIYRSSNFFLTLPDHLKKELDKYQQRFTPEDTDQEAIEEFLANTQENLVCVRMLFHEALGNPLYDQPKKRESNRIAEIMHHMPGWEPAGIQRFTRYGSARAWKRKVCADGKSASEACNSEENIPDPYTESKVYPGQLEIPFD